MTLPRAAAGAAGLATGYLADALLGDPRRYHPVAGFGRLAAALERAGYADDRTRGALFTAVLVGGTVLAGGVLEAASRRTAGYWLVTAAATWAVLGGRSLGREAETVAAQLGAGDLAAARVQLRNLVGRDTSDLGPEEIARAVVESVAENSSDAVVAPLFWGAVAGVPGLLGYRAVNTLDAMVGHRSARYAHFGWASARLDDLANWLPARLAGLLTGLVAGAPARVWTVVRRDAGRHPSPNAGVVEAAFAAALGRQLGGRNSYGERTEDRGRLGDGPPPEVADVGRAARLAGRVSAAALGVAVAIRLARR